MKGSTKMTLALDKKLEKALKLYAKAHSMSPEDLVLNVLREKFVSQSVSQEPRDDWERNLLLIGTDCGVSLPDSVFSSEGLYE